MQTILDAQTENGAWGLAAGSEDVDMTAMALQALAKYTDDDAVNAAVERALDWLSTQQRPNGGFFAYGSESSESAAPFFTKRSSVSGIPNSHSATSTCAALSLLSLPYALEDGSFRHTPDGESNLMATEQCLYALVDAARIARGESSLYRMH